MEGCHIDHGWPGTVFNYIFGKLVWSKHDPQERVLVKVEKTSELWSDLFYKPPSTAHNLLIVNLHFKSHK